MPRVSDQHLAARRRQILDAATRCFVRNGFHQTSMQDVIREAGLSVGAFYRYFRSKTELIRAIAEEMVSELSGEFDALVNAQPAPPSLAEVMREALAVIERRVDADPRPRIAVQVWGEALRDPELATMVADLYSGIRSRFVTVAARARDTGQLPTDANPELVGAALFGFLQGYLLQRLLVGQIDAAGYHAGLTALLGNVSGHRTSAAASGPRTAR